MIEQIPPELMKAVVGIVFGIIVSVGILALGLLGLFIHERYPRPIKRLWDKIKWIPKKGSSDEMKEKRESVFEEDPLESSHDD